MQDAYFDLLTGDDLASTPLLNEDGVAMLTEAFSAHPAVARLDALVLDDADTSNHHLLVRAQPLAGAVFYLSHDGDSRIVFSTVAAFLAATRQAAGEGIFVEDLHPDASPTAGDQAGLLGLLAELLDQGENDLVVSLIPSLALEDTPFLRTLAGHRDFFLGEAVATTIAQRPSAALLPLATVCSRHAHAQVANAGRAAVHAIERHIHMKGSP